MKIDKTEVWKWVFLLVISFGIVYPWIQNFRLKNQVQDYSNSLDYSIQEFKKFTNTWGDTISIQAQNIFSLREAVARGILNQKELEDHNIKLLQQYAAARETITNLEKIIANYDPGVIIITDTVEMEPGFEYLRLPAHWSYSDDWLSLNGINTGTGVLFPPGGVRITNEPRFTFGLRNKHDSWVRNFFSRPEAVVIYQNPNPYASTQSMINVVPREPVKWYERKVTWLAVGFAAGAFVF